MSGFFSAIVDFFSSIVHFISSVIEGALGLIQVLTLDVTTLSNVIAFLPTELTVFALAFLFISVLLIIVNLL